MSYDHISLYIPPRRTLYDTIAQLRFEFGEATIIADEPTKQNIRCALAEMISKIRRLRTTPKKGLVLFARGNNVKMIFPNNPVTVFGYFCDEKFREEFLPTQ